MRSLTILAILITSSAQAQICRTNRCFPVRQQVVVQKHVPVAVQTIAAVPDIYVVNNIPSIPQGSTTYSTSYPALSLIDVDRLAAQILALEASALSAREEYHSSALATVTRLVEINSVVAETLARGQAAAEVLREAGIGHSAEGSAEVAAVSPSLIEQTCARCHTGGSAKAGFRLDQDFDAAKALAQVASRQMPPDKELTDGERLSIIGEFLSSRNGE